MPSPSIVATEVESIHKINYQNAEIRFELFLRLPNDVLLLIMLQDNYVTFIQLSRVNKRLNQLSKINNQLITKFWSQQALIYFPFKKHVGNETNPKDFFTNLNIKTSKTFRNNNRYKRLLRLTKEGNLDQLSVDKPTYYEITLLNLIGSASLRKYQTILDYFYKIFTNHIDEINKTFFGRVNLASKLSPLQVAVYCNQIEIVKTLLQHNNKLINEAESYDSYPIHIAASYGYHEIARLLLKNGVTISQTSYVLSPLQVACEAGHLDMVKMLVTEFNANPKQWFNQQEDDETKSFAHPLSSASKNNHMEVVVWLVETQNITDTSTLTLKDKKKYYFNTALEHALYNNNFEIFKIVINKVNYSIRELYDAISSSKDPLLTYILLKAILIRSLFDAKSKLIDIANGKTIEKRLLPFFAKSPETLEDIQAVIKTYQTLLLCLNNRQSIDDLQKTYPLLQKKGMIKDIYQTLRSLDLTSIWQQIGDKSDHLDELTNNEEKKHIARFEVEATITPSAKLS